MTNITQLLANIDAFNLSIFSGTNFSVDVGSIIQSTVGKSEASIKIHRIHDFGLVVGEDLISFLKLHIPSISTQEQTQLLQYVRTNNYKYFRRRLITLALEKLPTQKHLKASFKVALAEMLNSIELKLSEYINTISSANDLTQNFQDSLVNYVVHYLYPFLGTEFTVENTIADALLYSGFSGPESYDQSATGYIFSAKDFIGYELAKKILQKMLHLDSEIELMKYIVRRKIEIILQSSDQNIDAEVIVLLRLLQLNGEKLEQISIFENLITKHPYLKDHKLNCSNCLDPDGYYNSFKCSPL